jgi:hypothetical protein
VLIDAEERIEVWNGERKCKIMTVSFCLGSWEVWQLVERDVKNPFTK